MRPYCTTLNIFELLHFSRTCELTSCPHQRGTEKETQTEQYTVYIKYHKTLNANIEEYLYE